MVYLTMLFALCVFCGAQRTTADLVPPFEPTQERKIGYWEIGGASVIEEDYIMLTPPIQYHKGCTWTDVEVPDGDWSITLKMRIHESDGGGGFALWLVDTYGSDGDLVGGPDKFKGLGILATVTEDTHQLALAVVQCISKEMDFDGMWQKAIGIVNFTDDAFSLEVSFYGTQVILSFNGEIIGSDTVMYNLANKYIGITSANDRKVGRIDLLSVEFDLDTSALIETLREHGETLGHNGPSPHIQAKGAAPLRKVPFNATIEELELFQLAGDESEIPEAPLDRLFSVIDEVNSASYEVASFSELVSFVKNALVPHANKWHKRTLRIIERVEKTRDVTGAAFNYTRELVRIFKEELVAGSNRTTTKIGTLSDLFDEIGENGIDEGGELKRYVSKVNESRLLRIVLFASILEIVTIVVLFVVVNVACEN